jgi:hypothetical protein
MVLQDAREKTQSLEKITLLPVQLRCNGGAQEDRLCNDELRYKMLHTRAEARRATEHFDEEVLKYLCEIQRVQLKE